MTKRYKDFDVFFKEHEGVRLTFKLFDKVYYMPASMPAKLMLEILRGQKDNTLDGKIVIEICNALLGQEQLNELLEKGFTVEQMEEIIEWASAQYSEKKETQPANFTLEK